MTPTCWEWRATKPVEQGYGRIVFRGRMEYTHRLAYLLLVGDIPDDRHLDHLCRNRLCCNPDHLEVVTPGENARRGDVGRPQYEAALRRTHCASGLHEWIDSNLWRNAEGRARCAPCNRASNNERARRKRVADALVA